MKIKIPELKELNKKTLITAGIILFLFLLGVVFLAKERSAGRALESTKMSFSEFNALKDEYVSLKAQADELERLTALSPQGGVMTPIEGVVSGMGLKGKIATLKSAGSRESEGLVQEEAELTMKKLTLNEAINVLYRLENAPMMLSLKTVELKRSFTGNTLDLRLTAALTRKR